MLDPKIIELIQFFNPWWRGQSIKIPEFHRDAYKILTKYMEKRQIIAIVGLRRVGKTVLLKQVIAGMTEKRNCLYFLFDNTMTKSIDLLHDIINYFLQNQASDGKKWIFLDEVHYIPYWQDTIKRFYDTNEEIKFIVTGSASLSISQSKESLAGRIFDLYLPPLSFREFLYMHGIRIAPISIDFKQKSRERSNQSSDISSTTIKQFQRVYEENLFQQLKIEALFFAYIQRGGFPELVTETDPEMIRMYIKSSIIDHILQTDIPQAYGIRRRDILQNLFEFCAKETTNLIDLSTLSKALGVNIQTIKEYLQYLDNAFLISLVFNYSGSLVHRLQKNKKVHIIHPSVALSLLRYPFDIVMVPEIMGAWVESLCFNQAKQLDSRLSFWRTPQKEEIDMILEGPPLLPIEVKYRQQISQEDLKTLKKFCTLHQLSTGVIITKNRFEQYNIKNCTVWMIPAWVFLLGQRKEEQVE